MTSHSTRKKARKRPDATEPLPVYSEGRLSLRMDPQTEQSLDAFCKAAGLRRTPVVIAALRSYFPPRFRNWPLPAAVRKSRALAAAS